MVLSDDEAVLCIAALEHAAKGLRDGAAAAQRIWMAVDAADFLKVADQMTALKERLTNGAQAEAQTKAAA